MEELSRKIGSLWWTPDKINIRIPWKDCLERLVVFDEGISSMEMQTEKFMEVWSLVFCPWFYSR